MKQKVILYSGKQCHLCDLALDLVNQLDESKSPEIEKVDIATDHNAYHLYAVRIPVLKREDNQKELGWPFDLQQLEAFLS